VSDLCVRTGRHWLGRQELPADELSTVAVLLRQLDFHGGELAVVDKELAVESLADPTVARLMTMPGVDAIAGISIVAAVGDFTSFDDPDKLVAYVGHNPKVRQSGNSTPVHGRISIAGRDHVRGVLVEAAWSTSRGTKPAARVLLADQSTPRLLEGHRRDRTEDDRAGLASDGRAGGGFGCGGEPPGGGSLTDRRMWRCALPWAARLVWLCGDRGGRAAG